MGCGHLMISVLTSGSSEPQNNFFHFLIIFLVLTLLLTTVNIRSEVKRSHLLNLVAPTMYLSKQHGHAVSINSTNTIAAGLAPPYAGET